MCDYDTVEGKAEPEYSHKMVEQEKSKSDTQQSAQEPRMSSW